MFSQGTLFSEPWHVAGQIDSVSFDTETECAFQGGAFESVQPARDNWSI